MQNSGKSIPCWTETKKLINIFGISAGMRYLHLNNVIHRDLKPGNILEGSYLFPKICDFGLSKILNQNPDSMTPQSMMSFIGTPGYAPPEAINSLRFGKPGDVYSFGLIVYSIMTNEQPSIPTSQDYHGFQPNLASVPEIYAQLIRNCIKENPAARPTFDQITEDLKTNEGYIIEGVDKEEYRKCIEYLDNPEKMKSSFKEEKVPEFEENDSFNTFYDAFIEDLETEAYKNLPKETQNIIQGVINQDKSGMSAIELNSKQINILFKNRSLDSPFLVNFLKYFQEIIVEIQYPSDSYKEIFEILSTIKINFIEQMTIKLIISKIKEINDEFLNNEMINIVRINPPVSFIKEEAFRGCIRLKDITIPSPVPWLGKSIFRGCASLTNIVIPDTVTTIGNHAFRGCHILEKISIPSSVTEMGKSIFRGCFSLLEIKMSNSLTSLRNSAFRGCTKLSDIFIPPSVKFIENNCFEKCSSLTTVSIPGTVREIQKRSFRGCSMLSEISFDPFKTTVATDAFQECNLLKKIIINTTETVLRKIDFAPFPFVNSIVVNENMVSIESDTFESISSSLADISLPSSLTEIRSGTFKNFHQLKKFKFDPYCTKVLTNAFENCTSLETLYIDSSKEKIVSKFDISPFHSITTIIISDNFIEICPKVFEHLEHLQKVILPQSLTKIGDSSFECCTSLSEISIPLSVTEIGSKAFKDCTSLTQVSVNPYQTAIAADAFENCQEFNKLVITTPEMSLRKFDMTPFEHLNEIVIPRNTTSIEERAFEGCINLTEIVIPDSVESIGSKAFIGCESLKQVTLNPFSTKVSEIAFENCQQLSLIVITSSDIIFHKVDLKPFPNIKKLILPKVLLIESGAFSDCQSIVEVVYHSPINDLGINPNCKFTPSTTYSDALKAANSFNSNRE